MSTIRRNTNQQREVIALINSADRALSADDVLEQLPFKINRVSVYRILSRFESAGEIHSIMGSDGKTYYASRKLAVKPLHPHVHFQCKTCHGLECVEADIEIPVISGYKAESAQVLLLGLCKSCA